MNTLRESEILGVEDAMVLYGVICRFVSMKFRLKDEVKRLKQFRAWLAQDFKCEKTSTRCWESSTKEMWGGVNLEKELV